jgi:hypothetical protein
LFSGEGWPMKPVRPGILNVLSREFQDGFTPVEKWWQ